MNVLIEEIRRRKENRKINIENDDDDDDKDKNEQIVSENSKNLGKSEKKSKTKKNSCELDEELHENGRNNREKEIEEIPSLKEIIRELRLKGQPITFFGETNDERWQRLKKLKLTEPEISDGYKNDLKDAMKQAETNIFLATLGNKYGNDGDNSLQSNNSNKSQINSSKKFEDFEDIVDKLGIGNSDYDTEIFLEFIEFLKKQWQNYLDGSKSSSSSQNNNNNTYDDDNNEDKKSISNERIAATKSERAIAIQTNHYIDPLLKSMMQKNVAHDICDGIVKIMKFMIKKSYIEANSAYLEIAIGNAPWPIGVTMSGIHNRPGKDRIATKNVAHVLNDETQRKYLQALKRIMKWCQILYPTSPSRSMDFRK